MRTDMNEIEKAFQTITGIILGKPLRGVTEYEVWLSKNVSDNEYGKSIKSGEKVYLPPMSFYQEIKNNILTIEEAYGEEGKKTLPETEVEKLTLANAKNLLQPIATTTPNTFYGESSNMIDCSFYYNSHNCIKSCATNGSKYSLYSFWPRHSSYAVGCYYLFSSQFCIKCYNSENLTRCFEVSDSNNCSDAYFCHNCDNLDNAIFCFNTKAKRYAVCNVEVGREEFMRIKKILLDHVHAELEKTKGLRLNIYNLGRRRD